MARLGLELDVGELLLVASAACASEQESAPALDSLPTATPSPVPTPTPVEIPTPSPTAEPRPTETQERVRHRQGSNGY